MLAGCSSLPFFPHCSFIILSITSLATTQIQYVFVYLYHKFILSSQWDDAPGFACTYKYLYSFIFCVLPLSKYFLLRFLITALALWYFWIMVWRNDRKIAIRQKNVYLSIFMCLNRSVHFNNYENIYLSPQEMQSVVRKGIVDQPQHAIIRFVHFISFCLV